jgi:hypothetical protein
LFLLPVDWKARRFTLTWDEAVRIDWGVILLFGGGLSVGELAFSTGLAPALGKGLMQWIPGQGALSLMSFTIVSILYRGDLKHRGRTSSSPSRSRQRRLRGDPWAALGATLGASLAFMLPVGPQTPSFTARPRANHLDDSLRHHPGVAGFFTSRAVPLGGTSWFLLGVEMGTVTFSQAGPGTGKRVKCPHFSTEAPPA